jgi:hypothetical protein
MKVKITCASSDSWYRHNIGAIFEVEETENSYEFKTINGDKLILKCHCLWD